MKKKQTRPFWPSYLRLLFSFVCLLFLLLLQLLVASACKTAFCTTSPKTGSQNGNIQKFRAGGTAKSEHGMWGRQAGWLTG